MVYLLECLQKTPPPVCTSTCYDIDKQYQKNTTQTCQMWQSVLFSYRQVLIFAEKKADVDAIHEYLLLKGVEAVAIHGGKGMQNSTVSLKHTAVCASLAQSTYRMNEDSLLNCLVVAQHYQQRPPCLQMSLFQLHSLLNISKVHEAPLTLPSCYLAKDCFCNICWLFFRSGGKNKSHWGV